MANERDMLRAAGWRQRHHDTPHEDYVSAYGWTLDGIDWFTEDEALVVALKADNERLTKERDAAVARAEAFARRDEAADATIAKLTADLIAADALAESRPAITAEDAAAWARDYETGDETAHAHLVEDTLRAHARKVKP